MYSRKGRSYNRRARKTVSTRVASKIIAAAASGTMRGYSRRFGGPNGGPRGFWGSSLKQRGELKTIDVVTAVTSYNVTAGSAIILLNGVATGTDFTNRIGRKIVMRSILFRSSTFDSGAGATTGERARLLIIYDRQPNGATPVYTDILGTGGAADALSPMSLNNRDRFVVLRDWLFSTEYANFAAGNITTGNSIEYIKKCYKKLNLETVFSGTAATIGSIATGAVWMMAIGTGSNVTSLAYNCRIRFEDA